MLVTMFFGNENFLVSIIKKTYVLLSKRKDLNAQANFFTCWLQVTLIVKTESEFWAFGKTNDI